jgi:2TM domain
MAEVRTKPDRFSQEEAAEIIREATEVSLKGGHRELTREDLVSMARELGVDETSVEQALEAREKRKAVARIRRGILIGLGSHLSSYVVVIGGLTLLDLATGPGWWVQWPAIGWGIGVASHTLASVMALLRGEDLEQKKAEKRSARRAERDARRGGG